VAFRPLKQAPNRASAPQKQYDRTTTKTGAPSSSQLHRD
jgi:hypothetical protein